MSTIQERYRKAADQAAEIQLMITERGIKKQELADKLGMSPGGFSTRMGFPDPSFLQAVKEKILSWGID